jgi:hypothetical protein
MQFYRQTTEYTTAACSLLMALNHFLPSVKLTRDNEFRIWQRCALLPTKGCNIFRMAIIVAENGLKPLVITESTRLKFPTYRFYKYKLQDVEAASFNLSLFYKDFEKKGLPVEKRGFHVEEIKQHLAKGAVVLLRMNAGLHRNEKATSNYLAVHAYKDGKFLVNDPKIRGNFALRDDQMEEAISSLKTKCKRDQKMLVVYA